MTAIYALMPEEGQLTLEQESLDSAALIPGRVLVEAETTVISPGTELSVFTAATPGVRQPGKWNAYPFRPGYGLVGRVVATGEGVQHLSAGTRVFCFGKHASHQIINTTSLKPMTKLFPIPEDFPADPGVMLRMALVALTGPQVSEVDPGDTVAVFGLGMVGNLAAQLYKAAGAHVIGLDTIPQRCEIARQCGIETVLDVPPEEQVAAIHALTDGKGAQITVEAVGHSAVMPNCAAACADFGQVVLLGRRVRRMLLISPLPYAKFTCAG
ncbi:MAG: zinc-binding dehydrogenase [Anaerolineae bacterium]|nr:zinc-binding dehydrogenase [Anaerolineae bacterium]